MHDHDEAFMRLAIAEAQRAFEEQEVPVGAVIVHEDRVVGEGYNQREALNDPTAHAEMIAITQAAETLGSWRLIGCKLVVTLEPCPMCAMAMVFAKIRKLTFATPDPRTGACGSILDIVQDQRLNHQVEVESRIMQEECSQLLKDFFQKRT